MDEMKSALERALERADRFGKLSPEEMRQQNELKYGPVGRAIVQRFFEHGEPTILSEQLHRLEGEGRDIAVKAALLEMIESIEIENRELSDRAITGITSLTDADALQRLVDEIRGLFGQYAWQEKLHYEENLQLVGKEAWAKLSDAGISGTAVAGVNIEKDEAWIKQSETLRYQFSGRLNEKKKNIIQMLHL